MTSATAQQENPAQPKKVYLFRCGRMEWCSPAEATAQQENPTIGVELEEVGLVLILSNEKAFIIIGTQVQCN